MQPNKQIFYKRGFFSITSTWRLYIQEEMLNSWLGIQIWNSREKLRLEIGRWELAFFRWTWWHLSPHPLYEWREKWAREAVGSSAHRVQQRRKNRQADWERPASERGRNLGKTAVLETRKVFVSSRMEALLWVQLRDQIRKQINGHWTLLDRGAVDLDPVSIVEWKG